MSTRSSAPVKEQPATAGSAPEHSAGSSAIPDHGFRKDVWTRTESKYRVRAAVLLIVNMILFAGVASFAYWLRSGTRFAPAQPGYLDELTETFWSVGIMGRKGVSLGDLLLSPISVQDVPLQIPVLGLLMAALISIPILVAILYRFWSSLPFIAVVGFLAVMPWLAITLLASCILASAPRFQKPYRFMSALLGLVPVAVYLVLAWAGTNELIITRIDPVDKMKFVAPWVLAIVAAALSFGLVLTVARLVDYRPGAIAPLLAVMFILPVALFEFHVGRDELYYRLIESYNDAYFRDVDASVDLERAVIDEWSRQPSPRPSLQAVRSMVETRWLFGLLPTELGPHRNALRRHQEQLVERCDRFLKYYPDSRYVANVLFIKARALDMRVDVKEFRRTKWIRFYDDFPHPQGASRPHWNLLAGNWPESLPGMVARLRLARIEARDGAVERATDRLQNLILQLEAEQAWRDVDSMPFRRAGIGGLFRRDDPDRSLTISPERILLDAHRLYDLLRFNRDPLYGYDPLTGRGEADENDVLGLLHLDPREARYIEMLEHLLARFPRSQIADNIELDIAKSLDDPAQRIARLEACLEQYPQGDAIPEVLYRLGVAYRRSADPVRSEDVFARLFREHPESIWARQAGRYAPASVSVHHLHAPGRDAERD